MRSACLSASRDARTHARAHTLNLTGRFARGNLKCKTETRADADSAGRLPRGIFCGRDVPVRFAVGGGGIGVAALTLFDFAEAVAIDEKLIGTACKKCPCNALFADKSIVVYKSSVFIFFYNIFTCA